MSLMQLARIVASCIALIAPCPALGSIYFSIEGRDEGGCMLDLDTSNDVDRFSICIVSCKCDVSFLYLVTSCKK